MKVSTEIDFRRAASSTTTSRPARSLPESERSCTASVCKGAHCHVARGCGARLSEDGAAAGAGEPRRRELDELTDRDEDNLILSLYAMQKGYFDDVPVDRIKECQNAWEAVMQDQHPDLLESILKEKDLTPEIDAGLKAAIESFKLSWN